jgi:hypothetical protein
VGQTASRIIYYAFLSIQCWVLIQAGISVGEMAVKPRECWAFQEWNHLKIASYEATALLAIYIALDFIISNKYLLIPISIFISFSFFFIIRIMMSQFCPGLFE